MLSRSGWHFCACLVANTTSAFHMVQAVSRSFAAELGARHRFWFWYSAVEQSASGCLFAVAHARFQSQAISGSLFPAGLLWKFL